MFVMPATSAVSERSFSALKRVKTYLRSTVGEGRLNHLMVLHVHKELAAVLTWWRLPICLWGTVFKNRPADDVYIYVCL